MSVEAARVYPRSSPLGGVSSVTSLGTRKPTQSDASWWRQLEGDATDSKSVVLSTLFWSEAELSQLPVFAEGTLPSDSGVIADQDVTGDRGHELDALVVAAESRNEVAFLQAARQVDWSQRPASDLDHAIRLALSAGAHFYARGLADLAVKLYPGNQELQKMARILAPPRVVQKRLPPDPSVRANQAWLAEHAQAYKGLWVALDRGILVAAAPTVAGLRLQLDDLAGVFITKVS